MSLLEVRGVGKFFGHLRALHDVSFDIAPGEIVGVIGPNGAGKSTLVDVISGRTKATTGAIVFAGVETTHRRAFEIARLGVARTFQVARPFPNATVLESMLVATPSHEEAYALLRRFSLDAKAGDLAERLDVAGRKRLQLALAVGRRPRLLLLDEVMAGLPPGEIDAFVRTIAALRADGTAIVVVEHVMRAIAALADRIVVLHHGEKIADDPPAAVFSDPAVMKAYLGPRFVARRA